MMKGKAIIQLLDENGEEVLNTVETNLVTNAFNDAIKCIHNNNMCAPGHTIFASGVEKMLYGVNCVYDTFTSMNLTKLSSYGIRLFPVNLVENADRYNYSGKSIAYGNNTTAISPNKGLFNTVESKILTDKVGTQVGVRLVWDFGTSTANNVPIKCISLTPIYNCGEANVENPVLCPSYHMSDKTSERSYNFCYYGRKNTTDLLANGGMLYANTSTGKYSLYESPKVQLSSEGYSFPKNNIRTLDLSTDYSKWFRLVEIDDKYCTVAYHNTLATYQLIEIDKESLEITSTKNLTGTTNIDNYIDFNKCGDNHLIFVNKYTSGTQSFKVFAYNLTTDQTTDLSSVLYEGNTTNLSNRYPAGNLQRLIDNNGKCYCKFAYADYSDYGALFANIYEDSEGNIQVGERKSQLRTGVLSFPIYSLNGVKGGLMYYTRGGYESYYTNSYMAWNTDTLFTINNLSEPITKSDANTMKIIYELTWGEVAPN